TRLVLIGEEIERWLAVAVDNAAPHLVRRAEDVARTSLGLGVAGDIGAAAAVGHRIGGAAASAEHIGARPQENKGENAEEKDCPAAHRAAEQHRQQAEAQAAHAAAAAAEPAAPAAEVADVVAGIIIVEAHGNSPAGWVFQPLW